MRELSLHILDLVQNAREAGASRVSVTIEERCAADRMTICIADNGRGMDAATIGRVTDPFFTTRRTRHVGLGLPLAAAAAQRAGGDLAIVSQPGQGTAVTLTFQLSHWDRAPLGDMPATLLAVLLGSEAFDMVYTHVVDANRFSIDSAELRGELGEVPLTHPAVQQWLADYLAEGERAIYGKAEDTGGSEAHP
ncbi:ATP-binding protein [Candidatus Amarolinea dominans]|uniref:ATP-binding protein n=1 Tax=Candidatus Amarolinea dominans TaxID=3140696 RepID=UPI001D545A1F|nr:ATP-binding protein [Anaerolineae bacterium]MBK7201757.1 ATP-binding protein [Anaerolineae bacterium]MBK9096208.1 ATP-binding protein [Anaerolineae bacterium]MBK9231009.1 ATP-binding protein [Anaerolineae bacterium]